MGKSSKTSAAKPRKTKTPNKVQESRASTTEAFSSLKPLTDLGNSERFTERFGGIVRYCPEHGIWFIFNGQFWEPDTNGWIHRFAHETVRRIEDEAAVEGLGIDEKVEIKKHAKKSASKGRMNALLDIAKWFPGITVKAKDLDANPWLLNCLNGTLDLHTGNVLKHDPADLLTRMVKAPFDTDAKCPAWDAFLIKVMGGDQEKVDFLQRVVGYFLTGVITEQAMVIFHGPGANGKSTLIETLRELLGDFALHTTTSGLLNSSTSMIRNDLARLSNARLVTAVEVGSGKRLDEALVKQLTGGDRVTARFLYREFFEYQPQFKLVIAANHKPEIRGVDHGIWRRIHLVPFVVTIPPSEIDKDLPLKLKAELPGILAWAVRGCFTWRDRGLMVPVSITEATKGYREEMDVLENFLGDRCHKGSDRKSPVSDLYSAYSKWSDSVCQDSVGKKIFGNLMKQKGYVQMKSGSIRYWKGLDLIAEA
jgi:putative DNA primase/helicase